MNDVGAAVVELRLLTHQPEEMVAWWAALLGGAPRPVGSRMTAVTGMGLQVMIERSQIALDYHPESSGVTAINLTFGDVQAVHRTLNRLARQGSEPQRVTFKAGVTALWLCDPNGTDVTICLPAPVGRLTEETDVLSEELDVKAVLADISSANPETTKTYEINRKDVTDQ
jgi:hypothetical protein